MKMYEFLLKFHSSLLWFVHKGPINIIPALVQIMAWRRPGDKALFEPMMVSLLAYVSLSLNELSTCNLRLRICLSYTQS